MAKKDDAPTHAEAAAPPTTASEPVPPPAAESVTGAAALTAAAAAEAAPASASSPAAASAEHDFDITLKNNDNPDQKQTVVARGPDGGLAAQRAMREHPGWTADHSQTHDHIQDTTHGER